MPQSTSITPPLSPRRITTPPQLASKADLPASPALTAVAISPQPSNPNPNLTIDHDPTREILDIIQRYEQGDTVAEKRGGYQFKVSPEQWVVLRNAVFGSKLAAWARDKLRYSYDPDTGLLRLRMGVSVLHETFVHTLQDRILEKLGGLAKGDQSAVREQVQLLFRGGSPSIKLGRDGGVRHPDISIRYRRAAQPPFVGEVALSQSGADLPAMAEQYILQSGGRIRTFLGIDIEHRTPAQRANTTLSPLYAKFSLFRLDTSTTNDKGELVGKAVADHDAITFHGPSVADSDASPLPLPLPLVLRLSDFCPRSTRDSELAAHTIQFSHQELVEILAIAEAAQAEVDNPSSPDPCNLPALSAVEFTYKRKADDVELSRASFEASSDAENVGTEQRELTRYKRRKSGIVDRSAVRTVVEGERDTAELVSE